MMFDRTLLALLISGMVANAFAAKPPPKPASDLDCVECVDTADIANGAVTTEKLSPALQQEISQLTALVSELQAQVNQLQALSHDRIEVYDGNDNLLGISVPLPSYKSGQAIDKTIRDVVYNIEAGIFLPLEFRRVFNGVDVNSYYPALWDIHFESFDCTGQAYVYNAISEAAGTKDVLVSNNQMNLKYYKTISNDLVEDRPYVYQSFLNKNTGACVSSSPGSTQSYRVTPVVEVSNPLSYEFPVPPPLRFEYAR
jgi:hypothetical protein